MAFNASCVGVLDEWIAKWTLSEVYLVEERRSRKPFWTCVSIEVPPQLPNMTYAILYDMMGESSLLRCIFRYHNVNDGWLMG